MIFCLNSLSNKFHRLSLNSHESDCILVAFFSSLVHFLFCKYACRRVCLRSCFENSVMCQKFKFWCLHVWKRRSFDRCWFKLWFWVNQISNFSQFWSCSSYEKYIEKCHRRYRRVLQWVWCQVFQNQRRFVFLFFKKLHCSLKSKILTIHWLSEDYEKSTTIDKSIEFITCCLWNKQRSCRHVLRNVCAFLIAFTLQCESRIIFS